MTIDQKLSAIKAINERKEKIDNVIQRIQLFPDTAIEIAVNNIPLLPIIPNFAAALHDSVMTNLQAERIDLIAKAEELMK